MTAEQIKKSQDICKKITDALGGFGLFGVELFLLPNGEVLFSEVSPRPHDTGMVTILSQEWSEFALHARAILGLPIQEIKRTCIAASAAVKSPIETETPVIKGADQLFQYSGVDFRVFGKPNATVGRRLAVVLARGENVEEAVNLSKKARSHISISEL